MLARSLGVLVLVTLLSGGAMAHSLIMPQGAGPGLKEAPREDCDATTRNGLELTLAFEDAVVRPGTPVNVTVHGENPTDASASYRVRTLRMSTYEVMTPSTWRSVGGYSVVWDFIESEPPRLAPGESTVVHTFTASGAEPLLPGAYGVRAHLLGACVTGTFTVAGA